MTIEQANDDTLIERYVAYRDTLSKRTEKRAAEDAPYKAAMTAIEQELARRLHERGAENTRTEHGTAYLSTTLSMRTEDKAEFSHHVIGGEHWELVDWRPLKDAVKDFCDAHDGQAPPGVKAEWITNVNIRRG